MVEMNLVSESGNCKLLIECTTTATDLNIELERLKPLAVVSESFLANVQRHVSNDCFDAKTLVRDWPSVQRAKLCYVSNSIS